MMEYKGYLGKVEFDAEAEIFHGEVINIRDVITFQGKSVKELTQALRDSVDDYLAFCKDRGEDPEKPYSGQFVTRISPELHRQVSVAAAVSQKSLNAWVADQLQAGVDRVVMPKADRKQVASKVSATRVGKSKRVATERD